MQCNDSWWMDGDDVTAHRQLCGAAAETLEGPAWASILPLAYLGRHDDEAAVKAVWEEVRQQAFLACFLSLSSSLPLR